MPRPILSTTAIHSATMTDQWALYANSGKTVADIFIHDPIKTPARAIYAELEMRQKQLRATELLQGKISQRIKLIQNVQTQLTVRTTENPLHKDFYNQDITKLSDYLQQLAESAKQGINLNTQAQHHIQQLTNWAATLNNEINNPLEKLSQNFIELTNELWGIHIDSDHPIIKRLLRNPPTTAAELLTGIVPDIDLKKGDKEQKARFKKVDTFLKDAYKNLKQFDTMQTKVLNTTIADSNKTFHQDITALEKTVIRLNKETDQILQPYVAITADQSAPSTLPTDYSTPKPK